MNKKFNCPFCLTEIRVADDWKYSRKHLSKRNATVRCPKCQEILFLRKITMEDE